MHPMPTPASRPPRAQTPSQREYGSFYWPLALNGLGLLLARHGQNGTLARYPDATRELASIAVAAGLLASLGWLGHTVAAACLVLGFSAEATRVWLSVRRFHEAASLEDKEP